VILLDLVGYVRLYYQGWQRGGHVGLASGVGGGDGKVAHAADRQPFPALDSRHEFPAVGTGHPTVGNRANIFRGETCHQTFEEGMVLFYATAHS
jgi:hypothetical protein